jgi:hypothetical protein
MICVGEIGIAGGMYDIESGQVIFFQAANLQANSILPRISSLTILPATLTLKTSPRP